MSEIIGNDNGAINVDEKTRLSLPVNNNDLGKFLSSLLGQSQVLERKFRGCFDINYNNLLSLHEAVDQRICRQAEANLCNFRAVIYFSDDSKRTLTTLNDFKSHQEIQDKRTTEVRIEWTYLVKFPGRELYEKQEITFHCRIDSGKESAVIYRNIYEVNVIDIRVDYTERTWGNDMEKLLGDLVERFKRYETKRKQDQVLVTSLVLLIFFIGMFISYQVSNYQKALYSEEVSLYLAMLNGYKVDGFDSMSVKFSQLFELLLNTSISPPLTKLTYFSGFIITALVASLFVALTSKELSSFITITETDNKYRKKTLQLERRSCIGVVGSALFSIFLGVVASGIFSFIIWVLREQW